MSVTIWYNIALATVLFLQTISTWVPFPIWLTADLLAAGNFLLRFKTDSSILSLPSNPAPTVADQNDQAPLTPPTDVSN